MLTLEDLAATSAAPATRSAEKALQPGGGSKGGRADALPDEGHIAAPLAKATERRAQREVAYEQAKGTADGWDDTVTGEAKADRLAFGARQPAPVSSAELQGKFFAETPLERRIEKILESSGAGDEAAVARREAKALEAAGVDAEQADERRRELSKTRDLLFYAERKAKYHARVKSKAYARLRKKRLKKKDAAAEEAAAAADPELRRQLEEEDAKKRIMERMDLRHSSTSAWARGAKIRGRGAVDARRKELAENLSLGAALRKKQDLEASGSESGSDSDSDDGGDALGAARAAAEASLEECDGALDLPRSGLLDMKFMRKAREAQVERARDDAAALLEELQAEADAADDSSDDDSSDGGSDGDALADLRALGGVEDAPEVAAPAPVVELAPGSFRVAKKKAAAPAPAPAAAPAAPAAADDAADEANPWLAAATAARSRGRRPIARGAIEVTRAEPAPAAPVAPPEAADDDDDDDDDDGDDDGAAPAAAPAKRVDRTALSQQELVSMAFATDDGVAADFAAQKRAELEPKAAPVAPALAGWGSWTGDGVAPRKERKRKAEAPPAPAVVDKKPHVIINPKRVKKASLLKVAQVPYPFTSRSQYERYMAKPVGEEWNARATVGKLTKPKLSVRAGVAIDPIRKAPGGGGGKKRKA